MAQALDSIIKEKIMLLRVFSDKDFLAKISEAGEILGEAVLSEKKVLLAGNGGSAADAQHFAAEMVGRYSVERDSLGAMSLCVDPSVITCIGNDYGYENIFSRQVRALGNEGDVFVGISTSGNSRNIVKAAREAKGKRLKVIGLLGNDGGEIAKECDIAIIVPSDSTPRIQEMHTFIIHLLCEMIEGIYMGKK